MNDLFKQLHLADKNYGASSGKWWSNTTTDGEIISSNPSNDEQLAAVYRANEQDYEQIIKTATQAQLAWRHVPAPKRAELVRAIGDELRRLKHQLGSLV